MCVCVLVYLCLLAINEHCAPIRSEPNGKAKSIITSDDLWQCASPHHHSLKNMDWTCQNPFSEGHAPFNGQLMG